ncbi:DUF935 family protein [uncultured Bilophila sp.]|uniref:phage portal protein family protein n=1 Tax=uncultured Bilophila sp. TaxID=529385 RepID=UPI00280AB435|nr:DUF935 family protein [uncultured Bilophila sp.]
MASTMAIPCSWTSGPHARSGIGHGFAALEIEWTQTGGLHIPAAFHHRPQSWFQVLRENRNVLRLRDGTADGAELWPFGWVVHTHRSKSGWLPRVGLFRTVAWAYLIRAYALESAIMFPKRLDRSHVLVVGHPAFPLKFSTLRPVVFR